MKSSKVSYRYSKALFSLSLEQNLIEEVNNDMALIANICKENPEINKILSSPVIENSKKLSLLLNILKDNINELTIKFINMLSDKGRESYLESITFYFDKLYKEYKNIVTVLLETAHELSETTLKEIGTFISKLVGENKSIDLKDKVTKDLIGGFVLTLDDKRFDSSIKHKVDLLRNQFSGNLFVKTK